MLKFDNSYYYGWIHRFNNQCMQQKFPYHLERAPFFIRVLEEFSARDVSLGIDGILEGIELVLVDQSLVVPETFGEGQGDVFSDGEDFVSTGINGDQSAGSCSLSVVSDTSENEDLVGVDLGGSRKRMNGELGVSSDVDGGPGVIDNGVLLDGVAQSGLAHITAELVDISALEDAGAGVRDGNLHGSDGRPSVSSDVVNFTVGNESSLVHATKDVDLALVVNNREATSFVQHITLLDQSLLVTVVNVGSSAVGVVGIYTADQEDSAIGNHNGSVVGRKEEWNVQVHLSEGSIRKIRNVEGLGLRLEVMSRWGNSFLEIVVKVNMKSFSRSSLKIERLDSSGLILVSDVLESGFEVGVELVVAFVILSNKDIRGSSGLIDEGSVVSGFGGLSTGMSQEFNVFSEGNELSVIVLEDTVAGFMDSLGENGGQSEEIRVDASLFTKNGFFESSLKRFKLLVVNGVANHGYEKFFRKI
jgi:hypothetical protein